MLTVRDDIYIPAPPETVFSFLDAPERQPSFTPSLKESVLVERLPTGGARARYVYSLLGIDFKGHVEATDYDPPRRIVWALTGDLNGTIRWYVDAERTGTRFTYAATYQVPGPALLRPLLTPLVRRYNERELRRLLSALKAQVAE
jgi:carbon monoxide dehydrogenase subunit G